MQGSMSPAGAVEKGRTKRGGKSDARSLRAGWDYSRRRSGSEASQCLSSPDGRGSSSGTAAAQSIRRPSPHPCRNPSTRGCYPALRVLTSSQTSSAVGL